MLGWLLAGSGIFQVKEISIEGGERVDPATVQDLIGIRVGESIFAVDLARAREALAGVRWIKRAQIRRILPSRIVVTLEERRPLAQVSLKGKYRWVDYQGYLLDRAVADAAPFLSGAGIIETGGGPRLDDRSRQALQALWEMGEGFLDRFSEFHLQSGSPELVLYAKGGFQVLVDLEGLKGRLKLLSRLLTVIDSSHYLYIDLRFGDLVMLPR